jgi:hypothetical protein
MTPLSDGTKRCNCCQRGSKSLTSAFRPALAISDDADLDKLEEGIKLAAQCRSVNAFHKRFAKV